MKKFVIMFFAVIFSAAWSIVAFAEEADVKLQEVVVTATKTEKRSKGRHAVGHGDHGG